MKLQWPKGLNESVFLAEYWQKKPLLLRAAFENFENPIDPNELAGLACEEDCNSRYIEHCGNNEWRLSPGPLSEDFFDDVTGSEWSLLVSDVEKLLPEFKQYLEPFRFLPHWRIDDLMISYAPVGGSVGAHVDQYDVFLLQADGVREWQIENQPRHGTTPSPSSTIALLGDFAADETWRLKPGDMLYLPPQYAHHGIAIDDPCMTWSIGFRAPSIDEMIPEISNYLLEAEGAQVRFQDPARSATLSPGQIDNQDLASLRSMLRDALNPSDEILNQWIGRLVTEPKEIADPQEETPVTSSEIATILEADGTLHCNSQIRVAYTVTGTGTELYANGKRYTCSTKLAQAIADKHTVTSVDVTEFDTELLTLLCRNHVILLPDND